MGPPRASNRVRQLRGVAQLPPSPSPPKAAEVPVPEMSPGARAAWDRTAPPLIKAGVIDAWSAETYARLCWCRTQADGLRALIDREGAVVKGAHAGDMVRHPAWTPLRQLDVEIARLEGRFGIAPADRGRVDADVGGQPDENADLLS